MKTFAGKYFHFTYVYQKPQSYEVQFLRYKVTQFFIILAIFCPFSPLPLTTQKTKNFGDVIILNLRNKRHDHLMYAYLDMEWLHRHSFLLFQAIFCSFAPLLTPKIKIWKKLKKKHPEMLSFYTCVPLIKITCTPDMMYGS